MSKHYVFGRLFAEPSFTEGMARVLDLGNTLQIYNVSETENQADIEALRNDWRAVGNDLKISISQYERGQALTKTA